MDENVRCAEQMADVLTDICNNSLGQTQSPVASKPPTIIPVAKKPVVACLNDNCCDTHSDVKCFERLIAPSNLWKVQYHPYCTQDLIHLDNKDTHARTLYIDISLAFSMIIPQILVEKLHLSQDSGFPV